MSVDGWNTLLVLGGIRSGKSEFAESLVSGAASLRYLATSASPVEDDPEWAARIAAHRDRRPASWVTEETAADPGRLIQALTEARADETLLVDDLGGWVGVLLDPAHQPSDDVATIQELASAVRTCAARLVLVSPEVGLTLVSTTTLGRAFTDAVGTVNQAVASAADAVVLVVAGQATWLKGSASAPSSSAFSAAASSSAAASPAAVAPADDEIMVTPEVLTPSAAPDLAAPVATATDALSGPTRSLPGVETGLVIQPNMELPLPDEEAGPDALDRLDTLDVPGAGLGELATVVRFAAATQATATPAPWRSVRVLLVQGDHAGGASAGVGEGESYRRTAQARLGIGALAQLTAAAGATLQVVDAPAAAAMEDGPALTIEAVDAALRYGWRLAEQAVDGGADLLVIAASGAGTQAAAAAVLAATAGAEPAAVLPRVRTATGDFDDNAWMARCAAVRDAMRRVRKGNREAKDVLAEVGGGDIAVVTGILLGATARRTPVLLDGPVGVAAALVSRDFAGQARHWCLLPDHGRDPAVKLAADVLGLNPLFDLHLDLGEGTRALASLPLLRSAIALGGALPVHPAFTPPDDEPAGGASEATGAVDALAADPLAASAAGASAGAVLSDSTTDEIEPLMGRSASGATADRSDFDATTDLSDLGATAAEQPEVGAVDATTDKTEPVASATDESKDVASATDETGAGAAGSPAAATATDETAADAADSPAPATATDKTRPDSTDPAGPATATDATGSDSTDPAAPAAATDESRAGSADPATPASEAGAASTAGDSGAETSSLPDTTTTISTDSVEDRLSTPSTDPEATTVIRTTGAGPVPSTPGSPTDTTDPEQTAVIRTGSVVRPATTDDDPTSVIRSDAAGQDDTTTYIPSRPPTTGDDTTTFIPTAARGDETTGVIPTPSGPAANGDDPTVAIRLPGSGDEPTSVITTGTGPIDDEDDHSWLPGFGNPRRSDAEDFTEPEPDGPGPATKRRGA